MKKDDILEILKDKFSIIIAGLSFAEIFLLLIQLCFRKSSIILCLFVSFSSIAYYLAFKDVKVFKLKNIVFSFFIFLGMLLIINHSLISFLNSTNVEFQKLIMVFIYLLNFIYLCIIIGLSSQESFRETISQINNINFTSKLFKPEEEKIRPGDVILGKKIESINGEAGETLNTPVFIPLKDRFLHMLILGPTGCGKTSQTIIPMINQDLQNKEIGVTVLEPKSDLAEKVYQMAKIHNREVIYFNPLLADCPYFNPLFGHESEVIENMATTFNMLNPDSPQFFKDMSDGLIRKSVKLLKRLYGDDATLIDLNDLVWNSNGIGKKIVNEFSKLPVKNPLQQKENEEIAIWFLTDYYSGMTGDRKGTKTYEHCSGVRTQISKLVSNEYLRKALNPPRGHGTDIDFDKALEEGLVITMTTTQGSLRDLGKFLGYFIILQLQSSVFRRPGDEDSRRENMLYIDEFQVYANQGFGEMLTQGRSYRVASHLATQARDQMSVGREGDSFLKLVSANARNKIIYPGISITDAKYYSEEFGEELRTTIGKSYSKDRYFSSFSDEKMTTKVDERYEPRFSPSNLIYRDFGQITHCLVKNNTVQIPALAQIEYIPNDLNEKIKKMVKEYNEEQIKRNKEYATEYSKSVACNHFPNKDILYVVKKDDIIEDKEESFELEENINDNRNSISIDIDVEDEYDDI
ncbi:type IV secretory system conjugative DNA transfer family protein [Clostridioides difficile]|nr:type IV secretory system conjugative DNA transfer family protein [Clostridioides difficile]MBY1661393.1 type IV secretory system conjugative DNA transfer family protein [Clostridioides difficile]MDI3074928.1 type IV secretory system conjugative DNA transfer family protein [Clostridioides difficile]MDW0076814.1 type IV secretory system conjugative DNA transfer family protein [Clostridioides difficile]HBF8040632.1 type IV secretory system conjugative DNA transfer family protein [Clostridioides